jgi:hypothetical protein
MRERLEEALADVNYQILIIEEDASAQNLLTNERLPQGWHQVHNRDAYRLRTPKGEYVLAELLAARANILAALANLEEQ